MNLFGFFRQQRTISKQIHLCPSCGETFDFAENCKNPLTTQNLKGLKSESWDDCNGPGEMAVADYGYVERSEN